MSCVPCSTSRNDTIGGWETLFFERFSVLWGRELSWEEREGEELSKKLKWWKIRFRETPWAAAVNLNLASRRFETSIFGYHMPQMTSYRTRINAVQHVTCCIFRKAPSPVLVSFYFYTRHHQKTYGELVQALSRESGHQLQALVPAIQSHTRYVFVSDLFSSPSALPLESPCSSLSIEESVNPTVRRYQRSNGKYWFPNNSESSRTMWNSGVPPPY